MISQQKLDLAVLYKLHQHADEGGDAVTPDDIGRLFKVFISPRRIELALDELEGKRDVDRKYHPHYSDEGLWQISRSGMQSIDRALRAPASFVARLHANGDDWLNSDEAKAAVLKKLGEPEASLEASHASAASDNAVVAYLPAARQADTAQMRERAQGLSERYSVKSEKLAQSVDWTKWGTIIAAVTLIVTIILWWLAK